MADSTSRQSGKSTSKKERGHSPIARTYLLLYNLTQLCLWSVVAWRTLTSAASIIKQGGSDATGTWAATQGPIKAAVGLAWLEVLHAAVGLAGGGVLSAFIQCFGRSVVLFCIVDGFAAPKSSYPWLPLLFVAWSAIEVIRYPYYLLLSSGRPMPYALEWLRYTAFLPLYPIGIASEIALIIAALPSVRDAVEHHDKFSLRVSDKGPRLFNFYYFVWFGLAVLYPLSGPTLYLHMLKQRSNRLKGIEQKRKAA